MQDRKPHETGKQRTRGRDDHVCLREPCVYCLVTSGEPLPASVIAEDPLLRSLLKHWDASSVEARRRFLRLLEHARAELPLCLTRPINRELVETYTYDRDIVVRDADRRPSPYRILPIDDQLGRRPDEILPSALADLVMDRVAYAWRHDTAPTVAATTLCRREGPREDFELEFARCDDRVRLRKFHVRREPLEFLSTIVTVDHLGDSTSSTA